MSGTQTTAEAAAAAQRRLRFEPIISLGNLITLIALGGAAVAWTQSVATNQAALLQRVKDDEQSLTAVNTELHYEIQQIVESNRVSVTQMNQELASMDQKLTTLLTQRGGGAPAN